MVIGWTNLIHINAFVKYFLKLDSSYCMQIFFVVLKGNRGHLKGAIHETES